MIPLCVVLAVAVSAGAGQDTAPVLRSVAWAQSEAGITLRFEGSQPLPAPAVTKLGGPDRLYFDLPGFKPGSTHEWEVGLGPVRRVRAALNRATPPVTRVVVDLDAGTTWRIERSASGLEFFVIIGPQGPPAVDRTQQIAARLASLAPALEAMRTWTGPTDAELTTVLAEAEALAEAARAARMSGTRDALIVSGAAEAVLAAARARATALADGAEQSRLNAISAASGALLLLERAGSVDRKL